MIMLIVNLLLFQSTTGRPQKITELCAYSFKPFTAMHSQQGPFPLTQHLAATPWAFLPVSE